MCESTKHILAVQTYGFISKNDRKAEGSKDRIRTACRSIGRGEIPKDVLAIWPQGYRKKNPVCRPFLASRSLGEEMVAYCASQPEMNSVGHLFSPRSWTTLGDIVATCAMVKQQGCTKVHVHFVTDRAHMKRVKFVWERIKPDDWEASFHPSENSYMSFVETYIREPIGMLWYWLKLTFGK
jgi:hypothetical protein